MTAIDPAESLRRFALYYIPEDRRDLPGVREGLDAKIAAVAEHGDCGASVVIRALRDLLGLKVGASLHEAVKGMVTALAMLQPAAHPLPDGWAQSVRMPPQALFMARLGDTEGIWIDSVGVVHQAGAWEANPPVEVRAWLYHRWLAWRAADADVAGLPTADAVVP